MQPAAGDAGTALGAALQVARNAGEPIAPMPSAALGRGWSDDELAAALRAARRAVPDAAVDSPTRSRTPWPATASWRWFHGRSEFGPRALGPPLAARPPRCRGQPRAAQRRQGPRAVPAGRADGARRARGRDLRRRADSQPVHAVRAPGATGLARRASRRSCTSTAPRGSRRSTAATQPLARRHLERVPAPDRAAGAGQHQPEHRGPADGRRPAGRAGVFGSVAGGRCWCSGRTWSAAPDVRAPRPGGRCPPRRAGNRTPGVRGGDPDASAAHRCAGCWTRLRHRCAEHPPPEQVVVVDDRRSAVAAADRPERPLPITVLRSGGARPGGRPQRRLAGGARAAGSRSWTTTCVLSPGWRRALSADLTAVPDAPTVAASQARLRVPLPDRAPADRLGTQHRRAGRRPLDHRRHGLPPDGAGRGRRLRRAVPAGVPGGRRPGPAGPAGRLAAGKRSAHHRASGAARPTAWVSLRAQAGNADDALMRRLHGRDWRAPCGSRPRPAPAASDHGGRPPRRLVPCWPRLAPPPAWPCWPAGPP